MVLSLLVFPSMFCHLFKIRPRCDLVAFCNIRNPTMMISSEVVTQKDSGKRTYRDRKAVEQGVIAYLPDVSG